MKDEQDKTGLENVIPGESVSSCNASHPSSSTHCKKVKRKNRIVLLLVAVLHVLLILSLVNWAVDKGTADPVTIMKVSTIIPDDSLQKQKTAKLKKLKQQKLQKQAQLQKAQAKLDKLKKTAQRQKIIRQKALKEKRKKLIAQRIAAQRSAKKAAQLKAQQKTRRIAAQKAAQQKARLKAQKAAARRAKLQRLQQQLLAKQKQEELAKMQAAQAALKLRGMLDLYQAKILAAIAQNWLVPGHPNSAKQTVLQLRLAPGGAVISATVAQSSGLAMLDRSAVAAVYRASPLPVPTESADFARFRNIRLTLSPQQLKTR